METTARKQVIINVGDRINMLTVTKDLGKENGRLYYEVKCDCGKVLKVRKDSLHGPKKMKSCGCDHLTKVKVGSKYNLLTVVEDLGIIRRTPNDKLRHWFRCKCECGGETIVDSSKLVSGGIKSCGCLWSVRNLPLLNEDVNKQMRRAISLHRRTTDPRSTQFISYGGRGIKCELGERTVDIAESIAQVPGFFENAQLDRIDNNGNYTLWHPEHGYNAWVYHDDVLDKDFDAMGNLRWVTSEENSSNKVTSITDLDVLYQNILLRPMTKSALKILLKNKVKEDDFESVSLDFIRKWYDKLNLSVSDYYIFIHKSLVNKIDKKEVYNKIYNYYKEAINKIRERDEEKRKSAAKSSSMSDKEASSKLRKVSKNNVSGVTGVCWNIKRNAWVAFYNNDRHIQSKLFDKFEDAVEWRKQQETKGSTTIPEMEVKPQADGGRSANHLNKN